MRFLSPLWGGNAFWTAFVQRCHADLDSLDFQEEVWLDTEALSPAGLPQEKTVLDVDRVKDWYAKKNMDMLPVWSAENQTKYTIDRCTLSTLICEVSLPMDQSVAQGSRSFLNDVDLVDFPGARSRKKSPLEVFETKADVENAELIVRGKVSYLFHLYRREMGISTMVYCLDDRQSEVQDVPQLVSSWIRTAIGKNPESRAQRSEALGQLLGQPGGEIAPFLVAFTKFNIEMQGKNEPVGNPDVHNAKWHARFKANFQDWFELPVDDPWVSSWTGKDEPFPWVFPIRDPQYSAFFDKSNDRETGVSSDMVERLKETGMSFQSHPSVQKFVSDPSGVWNRLMEPNSSGVEPLQVCLANSAHPAIKFKQIEATLAELEASLLTVMKPMLVEGDPEKQMLEAKRQGGLTQLTLSQLLMTAPEKYAWLNGMLEIKRDQVWALYYLVHESSAFDASGVDEPAGNQSTGMSIADICASLGVAHDAGWSSEETLNRIANHLGLSPEETKDSLQSMYPDFSMTPVTPGKQASGKNLDFGRRLVNTWKEQTEQLLTGSAFDDQGFNDQVQTQLAALIYALHERADFVQLAEKIGGEVRREFSLTPNPEVANLVASTASTLLNNFIQTGGQEIVNAQSQETVTFEELEKSLPELLGDQRVNLTLHSKEWMGAMKAVFASNVESRGVNVDPTFLECNAKLSGLLENLN